MNIPELFDQAKYTDIIAILEKENEPRWMPFLAYSYQKQGEWEKAMNVWNGLIVKEPNNAQYYCERGVCKFNLRFKHAIQDFNKSIELDPENPYYYSCRAYVKDKIGDSEGAVADYEQAHKIDPEDAITLNNLGLAEQKLGYTARARERFKNSDDLLGVRTIDSQMEPETSAKKLTVWSEFKKMISSKAGFKAFLKEAGIIKKA